MSDTVAPDSATARRRRRDESQAETRARVLEAAASVFTESGYHGASVAQIARAAGYSTGALYSNFSGKDDLFLAVVDQRVGEHVGSLFEAYRGARSPEEGLAAVADVFARRLVERFDWNLALVEFTVRARRDDTLRDAMAQRHRAARQVFAAAIAEVAAAHDHELPAPPDVIASALLAVGTGLLVEHLVDPGDQVVAAYRHTLFSTVGLTDAAPDR